MVYLEPPKTKNITIQKVSPEIHALFETLCDLESVEKKSMFESLLYHGLQRFLESRAQHLDCSVDIIESLEQSLEDVFHSTVMYCARYKALNDVPEDQRERVLARMSL